MVVQTICTFWEIIAVLREASEIFLDSIDYKRYMENKNCLLESHVISKVYTKSSVRFTKKCCHVLFASASDVIIQFNFLLEGSVHLLIF